MSKLGKRYRCVSCATVVLCLRPSAEEFSCCGETMREKDMEELPSGD